MRLEGGSRRELLRACEAVIKSYDPKRVTVDSHAEAELGDADSADADPRHVFIKQVFYGCVHHKKPLKAFMNHFYSDLAASVLRSDYTMYLIMAYLTFFRLEELEFREYRKFVLSEEPDKMTAFLGYVFDVERMRSTVKWNWMNMFDLEHVEDRIFGPIAAHSEDVEDLKADLMAKASGIAARKQASEARAGLPDLPKAALTKPKSPRIRKPRIRPTPMPERIPTQVATGKEPTYLDKTSLEAIAEESDSRRRRQFEETQAKYTQDRGPKFSKMRDTTTEARQAQEARKAGELDFERSMGHSPPSKPPTAPIRMNTAAYLREDALYKRKQAQEVKQIQAFEADLRDSTEYYRWQREMKARDVQDRLDQVERVRLLAKISAAEAAEAIEKQKSDNAALARHVKAESEEMIKQKHMEDAMLQVMNRQLVHEVSEVRKHAPREAEAKVAADKRERSEALRAEKEQLLATKLKEDAQLKAERADRVLQLRALAEVHPEHVKVFDPTQSAGIGLLDEMSLVEMRERLAINRARAEEAEVKKRTEIIDERGAKRRELQKRIDNVHRIRAAAASTNQQARAKARAEEEAEHQAEQKKRNEKNVVLVEDLAQRRAARREELDKLKEEEEKRKASLAFSGQGTYAVEEMHFEELLKGAEREIEKRQTEAQRASKVYEQTKATHRRMVQRTAAQRQVQNRRVHAQKAEELEHRRQALVEKEKQTILAKKANFQAHREKQKAVRERIVALNPYAQTIEDAAKARRTAMANSSSSSSDQTSAAHHGGGIGRTGGNVPAGASHTRVVSRGGGAQPEKTNFAPSSTVGGDPSLTQVP